MSEIKGKKGDLDNKRVSRGARDCRKQRQQLQGPFKKDNRDGYKKGAKKIITKAEQLRWSKSTFYRR